MAIKVGINGFGRIGRNIMRAAMGDAELDFVAVNDLTNAATLAHLLKYDSILGNLKAEISSRDDRITVGKDEFQVLSIKDPAQLRQERPGRQHFTDRDRVDPDRLVRVDVERYRQVPEPLPEARDILAVPHRLVQQVRRHRRKEEDDENAVNRVHQGYR